MSTKTEEYPRSTALFAGVAEEFGKRIEALKAATIRGKVNLYDSMSPESDIAKEIGGILAESGAFTAVSGQGNRIFLAYDDSKGEATLFKVSISLF